MSDLFTSARAALATITPELPPAALIVFVFLSVFALRRWLPSIWHWFEHAVPFVDTIDPGPVLKALLKAWQAIPGAVLGAAAAALYAGTSVRAAVWGVTASALAALAHEVMADYATFAGAVGGPKPPTLKPTAPRSIPPLASAGLFVFLAFALTGCGLLAAAAPYLAEAAVVISDGVNAVDAAQALLPSLHLTPDEETKAESAIAHARKALAAAAAADEGAKDLTSEQLDASLAEFRAAWADIKNTFSGKRLGAAEASSELPLPLAVRRVTK